MTGLKIGIIYFSATDVSATYARTIAGALEDRGCAVTLLNVTPHAAREKDLPIRDLDGFVFGFPVFSDFSPRVVHPWLPTLRGGGRPCALFLTYGARTAGYGHFHTSGLLTSAGFRVLFTAEFLGRHSFNVAGWNIIPDRPDEQDFAVARDFAKLVVSRFSDESSSPIKIQKPFRCNESVTALENWKPPIERSPTNPVRVTPECSMCRRCENECPAKAFDAEAGVSDFTRCISCMRCVYICPDKVIKVDERVGERYADFKDSWHLTEEMMRAKKSRIFTESWQTVS
jgi:NAD-dependent dihydropyrimidine dehydrogenase PreA subunit